MPKADRYDPVLFDPAEAGRRWQREPAFSAEYAALEQAFSTLHERLTDWQHPQNSDVGSGEPVKRPR